MAHLSLVISVLVVAYVSIRDVRHRRAPSLLALIGTIALAGSITAAVVMVASGFERSLVTATVSLAASALLLLGTYAIFTHRATS